MSLSQGKAKIIFEVPIVEKQNFIDLCKSLRLTQIEFLRKAIAEYGKEKKCHTLK